ncbi:MAG: NADH-ubiquinone oxidoreductase chain B, partial [uncultured Gemmatimonadetes bacterium]
GTERPPVRQCWRYDRGPAARRSRAGRAPGAARKRAARHRAAAGQPVRRVAGVPHHPRGRRRQLGAHQLALADAVRHGVLRHRDDGHRRHPVRPGPLRHGAHELQPAPGRPADLRGARELQDGSRAQEDLGADALAQVEHQHGRLRQHGRRVRRVQHGAGDRHDHPRRRVRARLPAAPRVADLRHPADPGKDPQLVAQLRGRVERGGPAARNGKLPAAGNHRPHHAAVRQQHQPEPRERAGEHGCGGARQRPPAL